MKAKDLMVRDWILHKGEPYQIRQLGIYGVDRDGEDYPAVCVGKSKGVGLIVEINEIKPIPITPEILEKNGWEERPTGYVFYTDGKRYDNSLWYIFGSNTFVVNTAEFQIKYVHQLQNALRLCGIEKEIEL